MELASLLVHGIDVALETAGGEALEPQSGNSGLVTRNANHGNRFRVEDRLQFFELPIAQDAFYVIPASRSLQ
jgi:hypothetical protein